MKNNLISIQLFPKQIQKNLFEKSYKQLKWIGDIYISKYYNISIAQFDNRKHVWLLLNEILSEKLNIH